METRRSSSSMAESKGKDPEATLSVTVDIVVDEPESDALRLASTPIRYISWINAWLNSWGLEVHGIEPTSPEQRTDERIYQIFFVWFSANVNVQSFACASIGPAVFGLGVRTSMVTCAITDIVACLFPAYFAVFGPKLGTRAMVQSRFSWGYYGAIIPSFLTVLTMEGYCIINCIIGGQTLGTVSSHLDATLGIVITGVLSLVVACCGYRIVHWFEMLSWIPNVAGIITMLVVGGKTVANVPVINSTPVSAASIMTFMSTVVVFIVAWCPIAPDYSVFHSYKASSMKIFIYAYLGLLTSSLLMHLMGSAFTAAALHVPAWRDGLGDGNDVGGLIAAVLSDAGGWGKFLVVAMALTTPSASALSMYSVGTSFMTISAVFAKIPRFVLAIISTAILIPVGIIGAIHFYNTFVQILSFMGYWLGPYIAIVLTEQILFRRSWQAYEVEEAWNKPRHPNLPRSWPAIFTFITSIGLIVVCMSQDEWTGPVARAGTGDIAMIVSFGYCIIVYAIARYCEKKWVAMRLCPRY